ncbi:MAG: proliferating cell nuclear antigen (pcna) [Candidatus Pacearchaeota archaeon]|nr:MAG: proliferating cell nuclear antigen (pcna) [Candidatus Pacearchaeota archaeon]
MLLKLDNPKLLADSISLLSELVLEVKAKINKNGFEITAIDPANVALISLKIPAKAFSQFEIDKDEELGINLEDFKQVLRRVAFSSSLIIERKDNTIKLRIREKSKRAFSLALINVEAEEKQIPSLNFSAKIELDAKSFAESINDASIVADSCSLNASEDLFLIEAKGTLNSAKTEFNSDEIKIQAKENSKAKYSLDYLAKFAKASKLSDKVIVNFSNDYPARFDFVNKEGVELSFVLAPRVEEEE